MTTSFSNKYKITLKKISHNPLEAVDINNALIRKFHLARILENIFFYENGSYLLSGQRGSGKTTLLNQLIYLLENNSNPSIQDFTQKQLAIDTKQLSKEITTFTVKIDIVKEFDEIQLLEIMLRQLTTKLLMLCQSPDFYSGIRSALGSKLADVFVSYVKDCKEQLDFHRNSIVSTSENQSTTMAVQIAAKFEAELNAIFKKDTFGITITPEVSRELSSAVQRSISLDTRELSVESLEFKLKTILDCLRNPIRIKNLYSDYIAFPINNIENLIMEKAKLTNKGNIQEIIKRIADAWQNTIHNLTNESNQLASYKIFDRVLIVIDDTDKADYGESIRVLSGLRSLFQSSCAFFIFTGSENYYEEWYNYNTPGARTPIDSIFHNVYYLPPLSIDEARELMGSITTEIFASKSSQPKILDWCSQVLLFVSQGFPRQIMRSLDLISKKNLDGTLELDSNFFNFFSQSNYPDLISNFLKVYNSYQDPRYEKCLYIASMVVSGLRNVEIDNIDSILRENRVTASYSPVIRNRVIEDLKNIWMIREISGQASYDLVLENCLALQQSSNSSLQSIGSYFVSLLEREIKSITDENITTIQALLQPITPIDFTTFLLQHKVLIKRMYPNSIVDSEEKVVIIGPREILGISNGTLDTNRLFIEQFHNQATWFSRPTNFRKFLVEHNNNPE